jgi:hypothetical protein
MSRSFFSLTGHRKKGHGVAMVYKIEVTDEDIRISRGLMSSGSGHSLRNCCPIALAVRRQTPFQRAEVGMVALHYLADGYVTLPFEAQRFVRNFDTGRTVTPISFEIDIL